MVSNCRDDRTQPPTPQTVVLSSVVAQLLIACDTRVFVCLVQGRNTEHVSYRATQGQNRPVT